ncbi:hypothetical protein EXS74_04030 [Candidatus Woesearchaeota archaeon]|nr:hypothetical protein [Candidatus Woesearchaeota archaeon]
MVYRVISFYRYVALENSEALQEVIAEKCKGLQILGRVLVGDEGINGAVCGEDQKIAEFQFFLESYFHQLTYREQTVAEQVYHKLVVRVRKEIVVLGKDVSVSESAQHISPEQLKSWYDTQKDFVIIDARNEHEAVVGKFKGAVVLPIKTFKEFPKAIEKLENLKDKEVVMYCTGGIRCEKASAYMKTQGFAHVYQLDGGIINYVNHYPETYYEGACFVFDDRLSSYTEKPVSSCVLCGQPCAEYTNCFNLDCDDLFVCCVSCRGKMHNTCSEACMHAPRQRLVQEKKETLPIVGVVENYYSKPSVVLVRVEGKLKKNSIVVFSGTTTQKVKQTIIELRDYDGNALEEAYSGMRITFPVQERIRTHDLVFLVEA